MAIHLDHNATTPLRPEVRELMLELLDQGLGNASSVHAAGRRSRAVIDDARERVAGALEVHEDEVVFTSGGTESNNLALFGAHAALSAAAGAPARVVSSRIEHAAVLEPVRRLEDG
ncbi:MAG: aminotransferase class V-fold PLP-dependent enzyme, partial [Planctomycetota bacterium]|nr:aminotransferase class V-fold PLP-dependent enzyme [Planctomycetota bacterium]